MKGQVKSDRIRRKEMSVRQSRIAFPSIFYRYGFETETGPSLFKALANLTQALINSKLWDK
jgi:hypothetical protein